MHVLGDFRDPIFPPETMGGPDGPGFLRSGRKPRKSGPHHTIRSTLGRTPAIQNANELSPSFYLTLTADRIILPNSTIVLLDLSYRSGGRDEDHVDTLLQPAERKLQKIGGRYTPVRE